MYKQSIYLILTMIGLCFGAWQFTQADSKNMGTVSDPSKPNMVLYDVTAMHMDKDGRLDSRIHSPKVLHFKSTDQAELSKPHLVVYEKGVKPWHILALHGRITKAADKIELWDNVWVKQKHGAHNHRLSLKTDKLTVLPKKEYAETHSLVTMEQPGSTVTSEGMRFFLKQGKVEFLSKAEAHFTSDRIKSVKKRLKI